MGTDGHHPSDVSKLKKICKVLGFQYFSHFKESCFHFLDEMFINNHGTFFFFLRTVPQTFGAGTKLTLPFKGTVGQRTYWQHAQ